MAAPAEPVPGARGPEPGWRRGQLLAWCVHAYTALGLVAATAVAILIVRGDAGAFRWAFLWMLVALFIDTTDGLLARKARVKHFLPGFDGRRLDDIIDYMNYTALPLLLVWRAGIMPDGWEAWLLAPLVASAYGFCRVEAKTADGYFLGFPSYWNFVAFYLYLLHYYVAPLPGWFPVGLVLGLAVLTVVPSRYLYPNRGGHLSRLTNILGAVWGVMVLWIWYILPVPPPDSDRGFLPWLILVSLGFPAYYLVASWAVSLHLWISPRKASQSLPDNAGDLDGQPELQGEQP